MDSWYPQYLRILLSNCFEGDAQLFLGVKEVLLNIIFKGSHMAGILSVQFGNSFPPPRLYFIPPLFSCREEYTNFFIRSHVCLAVCPLLFGQCFLPLSLLVLRQCSAVSKHCPTISQCLLVVSVPCFVCTCVCVCFCCLGLICVVCVCPSCPQICFHRTVVGFGYIVCMRVCVHPCVCVIMCV